jgi:hypothetical protein
MEIKIVDSPREFTFVEDVYTTYRLANNKATNSNLDEENRKDDKKLSDIRNKAGNNSIRSPYRLDVIGKVLKDKNVGNISINKNSNNAGISRSLINKEINFSICNRGFWHSSIYSTTNSIPRINCSICNDASN